ncbi:MAG: TonB-dependent receptor plug domain-containing protein, partial [Gammaproteobacteria bacterium]|nr:TonB-dependent receptor plug domain-containing protein [Gammaproteobacteria bacterium]
MTSNSLFVRPLIAVSMALTATAVMADEANEREVDLAIERQGAGAALVELGESAGIQVAVQSDVSREIELGPVKGRYTVTDALDVMLEGSGLVYRFGPGDSVTVGIAKAAEGSETGGGGSAGTAAGTDNPGSEEDDRIPEEIIVTGTRLKGVDVASPRITIDRQQIERGGYASIEDVLRNLPQNLGSANATATQLFQGEYGSSRVPFGATLGASGINLRGLGTRSSLVLINGRRKARSSLDVQDLLTDTSSIPLAQIERIEIITDGA